MHSALISAPLASTPPQHTPSRMRKTPAGVVAFRTSESEVGSVPRSGASVIETGSWRSVPKGSTSASSAPPLLSSRTSIPKSASYIKVEGFNAPADANSISPPHSPGREVNRASSLLSRQLSVDNLPSLSRPVPSPALASLAERLEAQVRAESVVNPSEISQKSSVQEKDSLLSQFQSNYPVFCEPLVIKAFNIARAAHCPNNTNQPRHTREPAFARCAGAAAILAELGADEIAVAGALLHDALDRTMFSEPQLRQMLGNDETVELVKRVSHMGYICHKYRNASNSTALKQGASAAVPTTDSDSDSAASHVISMLVALGPPRALLIRLSVALQETRALDARTAGTIRSTSWAPNRAASDRAARRERAAVEALELWAPLANRLGVWSLKAELEDRAFRTLRPAEYAELRDRLEVVQEPTRLVALVDTLRSQLQDMGVEYLDLSGRPKHLWGVWKKMQSKGYSTERIRDVRGLRIIVKSREDCYHALRAVEKAWTLVDECKNYIKLPKANGYQSLHAVADPGDGHLVEVQIRTDKMHYLAEYGADAAHWKYKESNVASNLNRSSASETNWAKYQTSQQVMWDKKCRPSGSPNGDHSLASILASMDGAGAGASSDEDDESAATAQQSLSSLPGNNSKANNGRTFQEYIAASGQRPAPPEEQRALVAVIAGNAFSVAELPSETTIGQLLKSCGADLAPNSHLQVVVNSHIETEASAVLHAGDVVELYVDKHALPPTSASNATLKGNLLPIGSLSKKLANVLEVSN